MRFVGAEIFQLELPFVEAFRHSARSRSTSDAIVVRVELDDGTTGHGECLPRGYVTGETAEGVVAHVRDVLWPRLAAAPAARLGALLEPGGWLAAGEAILPSEAGAAGAAAPAVIAPNAARAAVELAMLDAVFRRAGRSLATVLRPRGDAVIYSGVVTAGTADKAVEHARRFKLFGLRSLKIKVDATAPVDRVAAVRQAVGPEVELRADANGAFSMDAAIAFARGAAPLRLVALEQPMPRGPVAELARLRAASPVPLMADESLVTRADADALIAAGACDLFNVRISKCGGLGPALEIARRAQAAGVRIQVGCQVGETAILSAAGRHLAAHVLPAFVEGSFGTLLLAEDVVRDSVAFGHGGRAPLLRGRGLGVEVLEDRLRRHAIRHEALGAP